MKICLTLAVTTVIIMCSCGGTETTYSQMSEEDYEKISSSSAVIDNTLMYAYRVAKKYSQSVPTTITKDTVKGSYGTVIFSGTTAETNDRIILTLTSRYDGFGSWLGKITELHGSDTISLDKNSKRLLEYRTQLQNCSINYFSGTGSFVGTIRFNPINISNQTDTTTTLTTDYNATGHLQASEYAWNIDKNATLTTTFKKGL